MSVGQQSLKLFICLFLINQIVTSTTINWPHHGSNNNNDRISVNLPNGTANDTNGYEVIKEVTVLEIMDLTGLDGRLEKLLPKRVDSPIKPEGAGTNSMGSRFVSKIEPSSFSLHNEQIKSRVAVPLVKRYLVSTSQSSNQLVGGEKLQAGLQLNNELTLKQDCHRVNCDDNKRSGDSNLSSTSSPSDHVPTPNVTKAMEPAATAAAAVTAAVRAGDPVLSDTRQLKQLSAADDVDGDEDGDGDHSASGTTFANNQDGLVGETRISLDAGDNVGSRAGGGGGYVRNNQQQQLVPTLTLAHRQRDKIGLGVGDDRLERFHSLPTAQVGGSKVIFIPDRILLSEDIIQPSQSNKELQIVVANVAKQLFNKSKANQTGTNNGKPDSRCPRAGIMTLEHPGACDKYYYCENGLISELTCPNGLLYGTRDMIKDYCVYRWTTTCSDKTIPNPISSPGCRWQYGIFTIQGSPKCSPSYYECSEGKYTIKRCSFENHMYDDRSKSCKPSSMIGCNDGAVDNFHCPPDDQANTYWPYPRYYLNDQTLIHCVNQKPELIKCNKDERVDPEHLHCVPIVKRVHINKKDSSNTAIDRKLDGKSAPDGTDEELSERV